MTDRVRRPPDLLLLIAVLVLLVVGIVMVYSASFIVAHNEFGDGNYFLTRHLMSLMAGLVLMGFLAGVDYHRWQRWALLGVLVALALLVAVLVPGIGMEQYGARRWLSTGGFLPALQPSEFAKVAVIVFIASWLAVQGDRVSRFTTGSLPFLALVGLVAALIMREPDMGTTIVLVLGAVTVFWVAGANLLHVGTVVGLGVVALAWLATSAAYRADRLQSWVDPWRDPQGLGWHTVQTLIAIGSGGLTGRGLGDGRAKAYFLPNAHTDAIFAIIAEELGLIGCVCIVLLFAVIAWRGLVISLRARDRFGQLLAVGITGLIIWQAVLHMLVATNAVPYTGITLPFLSSGGSSLVMTLAGIGLILSVSRVAPASAPVPVDRPPRGGWSPELPAPARPSTWAPPERRARSTGHRRGWPSARPRASPRALSDASLSEPREWPRAGPPRRPR